MKTTTQATNPPTGGLLGLKELVLAAIKAVQALRRRMPFLTPMGVTERDQLKRMGPTTLRTVQRRLTAAREHPGSLPATFDLGQFERDAGAATALDQCVQAIDRIRTDVFDTYLVVGNRALRASNEAYAFLRAAAVEKEQLQPAVAEMASRKKRPRRQPGPENAAQPPSSPPQRPPPAPPASPPRPDGTSGLPGPVAGQGPADPETKPEVKAA